MQHHQSPSLGKDFIYPEILSLFHFDGKIHAFFWKMVIIDVSFCLFKVFFYVLHSKKKKWQLYVNPSLLILFVNKIQTSRQKRQECLWVTLYLQWQMRQRRHFMVQFHQFQAFKSRRSSRKEIVSGTTPKSKLGFSPHNLRIIAINSE